MKLHMGKFPINLNNAGEKFNVSLNYKSDIIEYIPQIEFTTYDDDIKIKFKLYIDKKVNNVLTHTFKFSAYIVDSGSIAGEVEVHAVNNLVTTNTEILNETITTTPNYGADKAFTKIVESKKYRWTPTFLMASGAYSSWDYDISHDTLKSVIFTDGDYTLEYNFSSDVKTIQSEIIDKGLEGKMIEGTYSPYIGTYTHTIEHTLSSPQFPQWNNTVFYTDTREFNIYQRELVA